MTLNEIAKKMCAKGKGILAADESTGTIAKRFKSINVENLEKNRLIFRQTLFNSGAMKDCIGGVILFDETIKQKSTLGPTIPELISKHGAIPGIKVDKGAKPLAASSKETVTEGLDGLRERLKEYYDLGARFTKWRAVYTIGSEHPSPQSIKSNTFPNKCNKFFALNFCAYLSLSKQLTTSNFQPRAYNLFTYSTASLYAGMKPTHPDSLNILTC